MLLILLAILIFGVVLARNSLLTEKHVQWASRWIIYVSMPAIALLNIPNLIISAELVLPIISPLVVFSLSAVIFYGLLGNRLSTLEKLVFTVVCGLANTSFLGFPVISALYPQTAMSYAIVYDQVTFLVLVCIAYSMIMSHTSGFRVRTLLVKVFSFPAFIAVIIALFIPIEFMTDSLKTGLYYLGTTMSPLAVLVVGYYIAHYVKSLPSIRIILATMFCLLITPLIIWGLFILWPTENFLLRNATIMEAAMPPMITSAILLMHHTGENRITAQLLSWGSIASIATIPLWYWLLRTF